MARELADLPKSPAKRPRTTNFYSSDEEEQAAAEQPQRPSKKRAANDPQAKKKRREESQRLLASRQQLPIWQGELLPPPPSFDRSFFRLTFTLAPQAKTPYWQQSKTMTLSSFLEKRVRERRRVSLFIAPSVAALLATD